MSTSRFAGKRSLLALAAIVIVVAMLGIYALTRPGEKASSIPKLGPNSVTLLPGVHLLTGLGPSSAYVIDTPEGPILFDTGLETDAGPLKSKMADLGLDWRGIRAIFITHVHGDHTGGAENLRAATGAKIHAGKGDAPPIRAGAPREAFFSTFYMPDHSPHPSTVDVELTGDEVFSFGEVRVRAIATPGHTPGSTCYLVERDRKRILITGDVIMQMTGKNALGTYSTYLSPRYRGDAATYLKTLQFLREFEAPDLLLPGHPGSDPTPQSPAITPARWVELIDEGIRDMKALVARFQADGADFLDGVPKPLLPDFFYLGDHGGQAVYLLSASSKMYLVNAASGPGIADFVRQALTTLGLTQTSPVGLLLTSTDALDPDGLKKLLAGTSCQVVCPSAGIDDVRKSLPAGTEVVSAEEFASKAPFKVSVVNLSGRGSPSVAYLLEWGGKTVALTGSIPTLFDHESTERLAADLGKNYDFPMDYLSSINRLESLSPRVWLPAHPSDGQNANLYDDEWKNIISNNYRLGNFSLMRRR